MLPPRMPDIVVFTMCPKRLPEQLCGEVKNQSFDGCSAGTGSWRAIEARSNAAANRLDWGEQRSCWSEDFFFSTPHPPP